MEKKIFLDSNIILDLYRGRTNLKDLRNLSSKKVFVTTKQVIDEYDRNRIGVISNENASIIKGVKEFKTLSFDKLKNILEEDEFKKIINIKKEINGAIKEIEDIFKKQEEKDQVYVELERLFSNEETIIIDDSEEFLNKARLRYDLGRIPKSDGKSTLCDQYIWESLLSQKIKDLIFVSRDDTYQNNIDLLAKEYKEKTNGNITIVSTLKDGLKVLEENDEEKIEEIVKQSNDDYKKQSYNDYLKVIGDLVLKTNTIGSYLQDQELKQTLNGMTLGASRLGLYWQNSELQKLSGMLSGFGNIGSYFQNSELQKTVSDMTMGVNRLGLYWQNPELQKLSGMLPGFGSIGSYFQNSELQKTIRDMKTDIYKIESHFKEKKEQ